MKVALHIGAPKTGTSAVQSFLVHNREVYLEAGVLYPVAGRVFDGLSALRHLGFRFAMEGARGKADDKMTAVGLARSADRRAYARQFIADFDREIDEARPDVVVLSDESLFFRCDDATIAELAAFLRNRFEQVQVICHIRHPVDYIRARVSQGVMNGLVTELDTAAERVLDRGIFEPGLRRWAPHFDGSEFNVSLMHKDSVAGFLAQIGAKEIGTRPERGVNRSLTVQGVSLLVELNRRYGDKGCPKRIKWSFAKTMTGKAFDLPASDREKVWAVFERERKALLESYLGSDDVRRVNEDWHPQDQNVSEENIPRAADPAICGLITHLYNRASNGERKPDEAGSAPGLVASLRATLSLGGRNT